MYIEVARLGKNELFRYAIMMLIIVIAYNIGSLPMIGFLFAAIQNDENLGESDLTKFSENPDFSLFGIDPNLGFLLLLLTFVAVFIAFYFLFPVIHKRPFKTLITWKAKIDWSRILFGFGVWLLIGLLLEAIFFGLHSEHYTLNFDLKSFVPLVLISLLILPIQTSVEELIFRGYLLQGITIGTNSKIYALIITSILFGAIHSMNPEIHKFGFFTMQLYYIGAGFFLGIVTLMDNRLELALGIHAATNFLGAVFVGYDGAAIQTSSLFKTSYLNPVLMTAGFYLGACIFLFIAFKRFNWRSFTKLDATINKNSIS